MKLLVFRRLTLPLIGMIVIGIGGLDALIAQTASTSQLKNNPATNEEIARHIRELGDPSYSRRSEATRRLLAIGPKTIPQLRAAAQSDAYEIALRAQTILACLDRLWFSGVDVSLTFSKTSFAWDDPVDLTIVLLNRSTTAARVPFEWESGSSDTDRRLDEPIDDARQVVTMLDLADFLRVTGPDGSLLELRVDDLAIDPAVLEAVQKRISRDPVTILEPQQRMTIRIPAFNRGWARYPLFDRGRYEIAFAYRPAWNDDELLTDAVGAVFSDPVLLTVTTSAPDVISRDGVGATVTVERVGDELIAKLINRDDQIAWINTNFGQGAPFAEGAWVFSRDAAVHEQRIAPGSGRLWREFEADRLRMLPPGGEVELARLSLADARRWILEKGAGALTDRWTIHFHYANPCDRTWQRRQGVILQGNETAPRVLRDPLPTRLLSMRMNSQRMQLALSD